MQTNSNLSVLVVDPNPGMRGNLKNMLTQSGISKIEFAVSSGTAIKHLATRSFDIILCEYDLGSGADDGQDGQQLLEDLRHHKLIGLLTIFIMITSEGVYSKVVSAAELTPTDYILKPFTVDVLAGRITRALERRAAFLPAYQQIGQGNLREAVRLCAAAEAAHPRYAADFTRLRAELHVSLNELAEAETLYRAVMEAKPAGWAALGLARTLFAQEREGESEVILTRLVAENPKLMGAYDLLARCHETSGSPARAQSILEDAVAISPHMVRRLRKLGEVALDAGDAAAAERSFRQVVAKAKYSEFRDPEDHVNLVRALIRTGDITQAGGVVRDLEKSLRGNPATDVCKAISNALLHESSGNTVAAAGELNTAVQAVRASAAVSSKLKIGLARSCLTARLDREASEVMLAVMNDVGSGVSMQQAMGVFVKAGRPDLAEGIGSQLKAKAQGLLDLAAEKAGMGDYKGAVQSLLEARHMSPGNLAVMIALARGILRQINELGWDHPLAEQCAGVIDTVRKLDGAHAQLAPLQEEYLAAKRKYGISG
jgi:DNA-binding NarL/FixJ family response regulator